MSFFTSDLMILMYRVVCKIWLIYVLY